MYIKHVPVDHQIMIGKLDVARSNNINRRFSYAKLLLIFIMNDLWFAIGKGKLLVKLRRISIRMADQIPATESTIPKEKFQMTRDAI
jgi:hypothetical protein